MQTETPVDVKQGRPGSGGVPPVRSLPLWIKSIPFVFSAVLFLSAIFAVFAPLPILTTFFRSGRKSAWLAVLTNAGLVAVLGGIPSLAFYLVFVGALSLGMAEFLTRGKSIEKTTVYTFLLMMLTGAALATAYGLMEKVAPWIALRDAVNQSVDYLIANMPPGTDQSALWSNPEEMAEWKRQLIVELPSGVAILTLVMIWANLTAILRSNAAGLRARLGLEPGFFQNWKAPEWMVWPTIVAGFFLIVRVNIVSDVAINVFRFLMAIYAIQGLSILSSLFNAWNIRGMLRTVGFLLIGLLMTPLLLGLGFFDLWFDFRAKFRQS